MSSGDTAMSVRLQGEWRGDSDAYGIPTVSTSEDEHECRSSAVSESVGGSCGRLESAACVVRVCCSGACEGVWS